MTKPDMRWKKESRRVPQSTQPQIDMFSDAKDTVLARRSSSGGKHLQEPYWPNSLMSSYVLVSFRATTSIRWKSASPYCSQIPKISISWCILRTKHIFYCCFYLLCCFVSFHVAHKCPQRNYHIASNCTFRTCFVDNKIRHSVDTLIQHAH